jgi:bifunctional N-acetylglucosamine-1-phosphate-uridyltransferase/glucosamine-1-phosphate-acetyltransferase GlmU-like protein
MKASTLFHFPESLSFFEESFQPEQPPWEWVRQIGPGLEGVDLKALPEGHKTFPPGLSVEGPVYIHESVHLPHTGTIIGPVFIGSECELRPGVFIRGKVIAGKGCVLGNSCEFKNSLLLDEAKVPHFSYVGDSVLGNDSHLGAGSILSNLRFDQREVAAWTPGGKEPTGMRKLGALLGDGSEIGSNAVLQPGVILGRNSIVMTGLVFNGYLEPATLAYARENILKVRRRDL